MRLNIFRFSAFNSKKNLKFEKSFPSVCRPWPTYSKLSDIRGLICEKFNFRKLGVSATEIAILKEN